MENKKDLDESMEINDWEKLAQYIKSHKFDELTSQIHNFF